MGRRRGLIDSNVLVAASILTHQHHEASSTLLVGGDTGDFVTSNHCLSEFYSAATRPLAQSGSAMTPQRALDALAAHRDNLEVLQLSQSEQWVALAHFSRIGGTGARLYDFLIGEIAAIHRIPIIVTWNVRHFIPLFPQLRVVTPSEYLETT